MTPDAGRTSVRATNPIRGTGWSWAGTLSPAHTAGAFAEASGGHGEITLALPAPFPIAAPSRLALKRGMDIALSLVLLVGTAPLLLVAALLIRLSSPGPVFFIQRRSGRLGREFRMFKLRTMVQGAERAQDELARSRKGRCFLKLDDDPRVTPVGRVLRRYSIDEIPQFWNVLKGDMSLVGPRPLLPCDVRNFPRDERARRFDVQPGVTGLWQVSGRSRLSDEERMALDLAYVDHWGLLLDLDVLARTPMAVLSGRGAC